MEQRGALILPGGRLAGGGPEVARLGLGGRTVLSRLVEAVRPVVGQVLVLPDDPRRPPRLPTALEAEARVLGGGPAGPSRRLAEALSQLGPQVEAIALLPANLPRLSPRALEAWFEALEAGADAVCAAAGGTPVPLPGIYRRGAVPGLAPLRTTPEGRWSPGSLPEGVTWRPAAGAAAAPEWTPLRTAADYREALAAAGLCPPGAPPVTLELSGGLELRTGCAEVPLRAATIGAALAALVRIHPRAERELPAGLDWAAHYRFSVNGTPVTADLERPLGAEDRVLVFSAAVGG